MFSPIQPTDDAMGNMVETAIYSQWQHKDWFKPWYARWSVGRFQGEVDMVGLDKQQLKPIWAIEIKWSNRYYDRPEELKSLSQFCKKNNLTSALVTTIDKEGTIVYDGTTLHFYPAAMYTYAIGENIIAQKHHQGG